MRQEIRRAEQGDRRGRDRSRQSCRRRVQHLHRRGQGENRSRKRQLAEGRRAIRLGPCPRDARSNPPHERAGESAGDRAGDARRLQSALRAVPRLRARRQAPFRGRQLAGDQPRRRATASISTIAASPRRVARLRARIRVRRDSDDARWEEVKRHYIGAADRSQAAGVRRDVLQFGVVQDPASQLLPQPLPVRPPGDLDRAHRRRSAVLPLATIRGSTGCATR